MPPNLRARATGGCGPDHETGRSRYHPAMLLLLLACGDPGRTMQLPDGLDSVADSADDAGGGGAGGGGGADTDAPVDTGAGLDGATLVSAELPSSLRCNETTTAVVTMLNAGTSTWSAAEGYKLGAVDDSDPFADGRVNLPDGVTVAPGEAYTFSFPMTGTTAGSYTSDWRMLREGVNWFGDTASQVVSDTCSTDGICDGTEVVCSDLLDATSVEATGGVVNGGDFDADGYAPPDGGGLDWTLGSGVDFVSGRFEVDVKGLVPTDLDEGGGGKVSLFELCGLGDDASFQMGLQKMPFDYHDGNNFRYYLTTDAEDWGAAIITGSDLGCYYSIASPAWTADETHHVSVWWSPGEVGLALDGTTICTSAGSAVDFDPAEKQLTVGNRCTHYSGQQAVARFTNLRVWDQ